MRRNKLFILGLFFAFVAVLSLTLVSGTWAKYTSTVTSAGATARVAKWEWEYSGTESESDPFAFNLFKTIEDTKAPNGNEEDIKSSNSDVVIAPGTKGSATIKVKNNSEVDATAVITFTISNIGTDEGHTLIPLKFSVSKNGAVSDVTADAKAGTVTVDLGELAAGTSTEQEVILSWEWTFTGVDDDYDTQLASKAVDALTKTTVVAKIVFTQVD